MSYINFVALVIATVGYVRWICKSLLGRGFSFDAGIALGVLYFVLFPLWICVLNGVLPTPVDFAGTRIPDLHWDKGAETITIMLVPIFVLPLFGLFKKGLPLRSLASQKTGGSKNVESYGIHFILYVLVALFTFFVSGLADGGHWYRTKEEFLANYGLVGALLLYSIFATRVLFLAAVASAWLDERITLGRFCLLVVVICALDLYTTGNRIFTLQSALVVASALLIKRRFKALALGSAIALPFGAFMGAFRWIRAYMFEYSGKGVGAMLSGVENGFALAAEKMATTGFGVVEFFSGATESVNVNVYSFIVDNFPSRHDYFYGLSLIKIFVFAIPRSVWRDKPDSVTVMIGRVVAPGTGSSIATTIFGEVFANFGVMSFLLTPLLFAFAGWLTSRLLRGYSMGPLIGFVAAFTLVRMPYSDVMIYTVLMAVVLGLIGAGRTLLVGARMPWRVAVR